MNKLVKQLKEADQDFEFYPTTDSIIQSMLMNIGKAFIYDLDRQDDITFLDIGAGNGKVLNAVKEWNDDRRERNHAGKSRSNYKSFEFWAIEKSKILTRELVKTSLVVGADFHEQTLLNFESDITFCNPPYKQFEEWTTRIIRECNNKITYLVIPERWKNNRNILEALKFRGSEFEVVSSHSFEDAEDRKAHLAE